MRTTLDLDDNLLEIARVRARERGVSLGTAASELMRRGLEATAAVSRRGFPVLQAPSGAPVGTDEIVAAYRDETPSESRPSSWMSTSCLP